MNKNELIVAIAEKAGISKGEVEGIFSATFEVIAKAMIEQDKVIVPGFGSFGVKVREERKGRNPGTGKEMIIPKAIVPVFKAGAQLKTSVNTVKAKD